MRFLLILIFLSCPIFSQAKTVAYYTYLKARKPIKKAITLEELKQTYTIIKQSSLNPPTPHIFFNDYLRFKMGVEVGLNEKTLVKSPDIETKIVNPFLKRAFHQELYKALAEFKLKKQMEKLDKTAANLSSNALKRLYANEPEFNYFFISIQHPINPSPKQVSEAERRAKKIHTQVIKSKKPFLELVALYSDDKTNGVLGINLSRAAIIPEVYAKLKGMKNNSISRPIRAPHGYIIAKLNRRIPFSEANQVAIKANYFNRERTKIFNNYFNGLKKTFKVNVVNPAFIKTL